MPGCKHRGQILARTSEACPLRMDSIPLWTAWATSGGKVEWGIFPW
jgi:hypothetical protein